MSLIYPSYFPNISSYIVISQSKSICFEVEDNYQKQTFRNRCYIYGANGKLGLHIPVHYTQLKRQKTKDIRIDNSTNWKSIHWKSIESAYRTSPFFEFYEDDFQAIYENKSEWLMEFNFQCIDLIQQCLDVDFNCKTSTFYQKETEFDYRFLINVKNHENIQTHPYIQVFKNKHGYLNNLSVLDVLFNLGPETLPYFLNHTPVNI
jgi:hypothetical protein